MKRLSLSEIVKQVITDLKYNDEVYVCTEFRAVAMVDASELQSLCIQGNDNTEESNDKTKEVVEAVKKQIRDYYKVEFEDVKLINCTSVMLCTDRGISLNMYETDCGFWLSLVYNLD